MATSTSPAARTHRIHKPAQPRSARGDVAMAGARCIGTHPEGIQLSIREMKTQLDCLASDFGEVSSAFPLDPLGGPIGVDRRAVGACEWRDRRAVAVDDLNAELTF